MEHVDYGEVLRANNTKSELDAKTCGSEAGPGHTTSLLSFEDEGPRP